VFSSAGGARGLVIDDPSDTWSHGVKAFDKQVGEFSKPVVTVLENGPVRGHVQIRTTYGASTLTLDWLLYAGATTLEARATLDWHERHKMLKLSFPVDVQNPTATYEVPFGTIVRPPNGDEEPGQRWLDVSGAAGGLTVINDAKYGYSVAGGDLRVSIARSAPYAHHMPAVLDPARDHIWQDQGVQSLRLLLVPHTGSWQDAGVARLAEQFTSPLPVVWQGIHPGTRPQSASFVSIDAPNVLISAIKQAETGDDLVLRCYETAGRAVKATVRLSFADRVWSGEFKPYEIKTLRMDRRNGTFKPVNALEE
jgi:alpha-mannosidase